MGALICRRPAASRRGMLALLFAGLLALAGASAADAKRVLPYEKRPILFVHGFESAGSNFASQAMRFESNQYKHTWIDAIDYDSTAAAATQVEVDKQIEEAIAELKAKSGKSQVDVIAHSEGTTVMYDYLTEGEHAAEHRESVARYANVDGQEKNPGVPTLALWAGRCGDATCEKPERNMEGAENVFIPDSTHVQTATSPESFQAIYKFFRNKLPRRDIVPHKGKITLAGKALEFPVNTGAAGDTLKIWPLNADGTRASTTPIYTTTITDISTGGGAFGPVTATAGQRYEFELSALTGKTLHVYMEPFVRSDYDIRLLASTALEEYAGTTPGSSGAVMIRYKEYWGNQPGENDQLLINGLNICTPTLCPYEKEVNAYFAFNFEGKDESTLSEDPVLSALPFIQGADVYIPASTPPDETVTYELRSRGGSVQTLDVPNWDSTTDQVQIFWNDYESLNF